MMMIGHAVALINNMMMIWCFLIIQCILCKAETASITYTKMVIWWWRLKENELMIKLPSSYCCFSFWLFGFQIFGRSHINLQTHTNTYNNEYNIHACMDTTSTTIFVRHFFPMIIIDGWLEKTNNKNENKKQKKNKMRMRTWKGKEKKRNPEIIFSKLHLLPLSNWKIFD